MKSQLLPGQLGEFIQEWSDLETKLQALAQKVEPRTFSVREAIEILGKKNYLEQEFAYELHELRKFRNLVVHEPKKINVDQLDSRIYQIRSANQRLSEIKKLS